MLNELKIIAARDKHDCLGTVEKSLQQLKFNVDFDYDYDKVDNLVVSGLGGSALYAEMAMVWPGVSVPYVVSKDYDIPDFVGENSLFIAVSFSGNTEETLAALRAAESRKAKIAVIASGGDLAKIAAEKKYPFIKIDSNIVRPRFATFEGFKALCLLLEAAKLNVEPLSGIDQALNFLEVMTTEWRSDSAINDNLAKQLALEMAGGSVIIYSSNRLSPAALAWKLGLNENAKNLAWTGCYPEFCHNELTGWTSQSQVKQMLAVNFISSLDNQRIAARFAISEKLLSGRWPSPYNLEVKGSSTLEQMLWLIVLGNFVSIYLAILNGVDPASGATVDKLKKELSKE